MPYESTTARAGLMAFLVRVNRVIIIFLYILQTPIFQIPNPRYQKYWFQVSGVRKKNIEAETCCEGPF
jgi:hypothetical protein